MIDGTRAATNPYPKTWKGKESVMVVASYNGSEGFNHNQSLGRALGGSVIRHPDVKDCTVTNINHVEAWNDKEVKKAEQQ
mmetsp:Transcript_47902/g.113838  ORF Transcript_47902/g.113838 Transcript_47902/m.113838 type:complete len:80 (+) Transcript_47902:93-332(+)